MDTRSQGKNQSDLFEQVQTADKKIRRKTRFLLPDLKNSVTVSYETALFFIIGVVMVSIITFSLGVEKGRYDEKKNRAMILQHVTYGAQSQSKPELKKGASNVATPKPKNIKSR